MLLLDYNQYDPLVENSSQGYEMAGEVGLGGGGGGGGGEFGSVCLRCPYCGLEQAAAPVLYYKPSQYHLQLARLLVLFYHFLLIIIILYREGKFNLEKLGPKKSRYLCKQCKQKFTV